MTDEVRRAEKARKIELLEAMIRDFTSTAAGLAREIVAEEERTRIKDPNHVAYSTLATALAMRRGKLLMSAAAVEVGLLATRREVDEATAMASREAETAAGASSMMLNRGTGENRQEISHAA